MKSLRKIILIVLAAVCAACLLGVLACSKKQEDGTFHTVIFRKANGVTYSLPEGFSSGMEVAEGTEMKFSVSLAADAQGDAKVYSTIVVPDESVTNGTKEQTDELTKNEDGTYSFTVTSDTEIHVEGITAVGDYNRFSYRSNPAVSYVGEVQSGMYVKSGYTVAFKLNINDNYRGTPAVHITTDDGTTSDLQPDGEGNYSFSMTRPTELWVDGLKRRNTVTYNKRDSEGSEIRVGLTYEYNDDGQTKTGSLGLDDSVLVDTGESFDFRLDVSVYYKDGYEVVVNTVIVKPENGVYHYVLEKDGDVEISITGLELDDPFTARENGGSGTAADPFRLSRPIDLYQMAMLINGGWYTDGTYYSGYYRLENDIDFEGEQLFIIGDNGAANGTAIFSGDFNGNNHTISNFYIEDTVIDQELYVDVFMPNIGMFGYVVATLNRSPAIYNLTLDDFTIDIDASQITDEGGTNICAGGIVGLGIGVDIAGCSVKNAQVNVTADDQSYAYVGGIIGFQQSAVSDTVTYNSSVRSCTADVEISTAAGYTYALGGITGMLVSALPTTGSYIINCSSSGDLRGAMRVGGIVGCTSENTAVINSWSSCNIRANSSLQSSTATQALAANSYAGGVAGYAGYNSVVYGSFSTSTSINAASAHGTAYKGGVLGGTTTEDDAPDVNSLPAVMVNCYPSGDETVTVDENFVRNTMQWDTQDWSYSEGKLLPNLGTEQTDTDKDYTITFNYKDEQVGGQTTDTLEIKVRGNAQAAGEKSGYYTMAYWYNNYSDELPEYVESADKRSYGYYFDESLTKRVPYSFVPTGDMTIYVGFADYGEVAGVYYLAGPAGSEAVLTLNEDGTCEYRHGALNLSSHYIYNGEYVAIIDTYIGDLYNFADDMYRQHYLSKLYTFKGEIDGQAIKITGGHVAEVEVVTEDGQSVAYETGNYFTMFPDSAPVTGMKSNGAFKFGTYYGTDVEYTFNANGTGTRTRGAQTTAFTYTITTNSVTITYAGGTTETGTVAEGAVTAVGSDNSLSAMDKFEGVWETSATSHKRYTFDGKGGWEYVSYGYNNGSEVEKDTAEGTYTIAGDIITLKLSDPSQTYATAELTSEGFVKVTKDGLEELCYARGSYVGDWYFGSERNTFNLKLGGISAAGYGTAVLTSSDGSDSEYSYSVSRTSGSDAHDIITLYNNYTVYAVLNFDISNLTLTGSVNGTAVRFTLFDVFRGTWISDKENMNTINFNGNGLYNLSGDRTSGAIAVRGTVRITSGTTTTSYSYSLTDATMKGTFTIGSTVYTFEYDEKTSTVKVTAGEDSFVIGRLDEWSRRALVDDKGNVYVFDGRGALEKGGTITVTAPDGEPEGVYNYKIQPDGSLNVKDTVMTTEGTIAVDGTGWKLTLDGDETTLTLSTPFSGDWHVGGHPAGDLKIGKMGNDNTATGQFYDDSDVTFTYHPDGGYVTFTYDGTTLSAAYGGKTVYIRALDGEGGYELRIGTSLNNCTVVCVSEADSLYGKEFKDSSNGTLVFDGAGTTTIGSGIAVLRNAAGQTIAIYAYVMDDFGHAYISSDSAMVFAPCEAEAADAFTCGAESYHFVRPDSVYGLTVKDGEDDNITYSFDGIGHVTMHDSSLNSDTVYSYVIGETDTVTQKISFTLTLSNETYSATLDISADRQSDWTFSVDFGD